MRIFLTILFFIFCSVGKAQDNRRVVPLLLTINVNQVCPNKPTVVVVSDIDAQRFLCAAEISTPIIGIAMNTLVKQAKDSSVWTLWTAAYPLRSDGVLKARSEQTRYNLKDTATFKITWSNASFSASGVDFTTSGGNGQTGVTPNTHLSQTSTSIGYYSGESSSVSGFDMSSNSGSTVQLRLRVDDGAGVFSASMYNGSSTTLSAANGGTLGFFIATRTSSTAVALYKNGTQVATASLAVGSQPSAFISIGNAGQREVRFVIIGSGFTAAQARATSNIVNAFLTTVGYNVYFIVLLIPADVFRRRKRSKNIEKEYKKAA